MGVLLDIEVALQSKLSTLSCGFEVDIAWPNIAYDPADSVPYLRPTYLPARAGRVTLTGGTYHRGIYQIDIFVPLDHGTNVLDVISDDIYTLFRNEDLTENSHIIEVQNINRGLVKREEAWWHGFIELQFQCFDY